MFQTSLFQLPEHLIQNAIRDYLDSQKLPFWRVNVLSGFTGKWQRNSNGSVTIFNPSWVSSGVPKGFPDLIGCVPITITPEMVGKTIGVFSFMEVKTNTGKVSQDQQIMHRVLWDNAAAGGVVRSIDDAVKLIKKIKGDDFHDQRSSFRDR